MPIASFAVFARRLRYLSWREVFECAWIALICVILLKLAMPTAANALLRPLVLAVPLSIIAAKYLSHLPDALARTRAALTVRDWPGTSLAWLPPELVGLLRLGRAQWRGFACWLLRRPQSALPAGQSLTYLERGAYRTAFVIILLATLFELPLHALVLPLFLHDAASVTLLYVTLLCVLLPAGVLGTLIWVLGDRWLVGPGCHVLDADGLVLRVGARTHGAIPWQAIRACERIAEPATAWCRRHGIHRRDTLLVSPLDKPNTILILNHHSAVRLTHLGAERTALRAVFLYLDRPQVLIERLGAANLQIVKAETHRR
jgi:hypothetical protein